MYSVQFLEEAKKDYSNLSGDQRKLIDKGINRLEEKGDQIGDSLGNNQETKLLGAKKLKFRRAGLRIIFRVNKENIEIIDIVAIGKRSDSEIYKIAHNRLTD